MGISWLRFLIDNEIDFIIRLKKGTYKEAVDQSEGRSYEQLRNKVRRSKVASKVLNKSFVLEGMPLNLVVLKNGDRDADDSVIYLLTSLSEPAWSVAEKYRMRWKIERGGPSRSFQAYEDQRLFAGSHESWNRTEVPVADGRCGVCLCDFNQGRVKNLSESAGETVRRWVTRKGGVCLQARHKQLDAILRQPAHFLPTPVQ